MNPDGQECVPLVDDDGQVVGHARVSPELGEDGRRALAELVQAVRRHVAEQDAADPVAAAERARRYTAGQQRIRERLKRLRGEP